MILAGFFFKDYEDFYEDFSVVIVVVPLVLADSRFF